MKHLTLLALLLSISILTSCSDYEDFPADVYSKIDTKATEPNDTTGSSQISIQIDEPDVEDIDYVITLP